MSDAFTKNARALRRNMTKEERHLWYDFLKELDVPVKRQFVIGTYIVDFCIYSARLVIELDGSQHFETRGLANDQHRDRFLMERGFTVLRYSNRDVNLHFRSVCNDILLHLHRDI